METTEPSKAELGELRVRLGEAAYELRMEKEHCLHREEGDGRLLGGIEQLFDFYGFIGKCLKLSGLWERSVRNYLDIKRVDHTVFVEGLPKVFEGYRLLQLTDLHADLHVDFIESVRSAIEPLEYDVIVITGDFRSSTFGDHTGATTAVVELAQSFKTGCYAVLGNHDSIEKVPRLESAGIRLLLNEHVVIEREGAQLCLVGIDDPNYYQTHDFERAMAGMPDTDVKILLSHSPQTYLEAAKLGFDLQLSGHTHGGQICLPGGWVIVHDGTSPRRLLQGAWSEAGMQGYTSRGTGGTGLPVRLNCPAEVTLHTLRNKISV